MKLLKAFGRALAQITLAVIFVYAMGVLMVNYPVVFGIGFVLCIIAFITAANYYDE